MAYKDPKAALAAQGLPEFPIGTLDELNASNLPASMFPSCAEPRADGSVRGCDHWHICSMSYKGKPSSEGGGPRMHCWERIKSAENGGGVVRNAQPCYYGVAGQENAQGNGEILRVIANEGEDYEALTFISKPKPTDLFNREQELVKFTVPAFVRPANNKKTAAQVLRAEIMEKEKQRVQQESAAETFGIAAGVTPLDKRSGGSRKGVQKEG